jgi:hypothetical protein
MGRNNPKVIVLGFMGRTPISGVIWQHLHYLVGLQRLGCEVWYVEDTSIWPYDPKAMTVTDDERPVIELLGKLASEFGFEDKWIYRARFKNPFITAGQSDLAYRQLLADADCALNICGAHELHEEIAIVKKLIYIESDPGVEQILIDQGGEMNRDFLQSFHYRFTFGESIGTDAFPVPLYGLEWLPTRQPVVTDFWLSAAEHSTPSPMPVFTSICNWSTAGKKDIHWRGSTYLWSKSLEFLRFIEAPHRSQCAFELVTDIKVEDQQQRFFTNGWTLRLPYELSADWQAYRDYIASSWAEFTCAKDQYIRLSTGWFSDRSACYLAAGRPVITQETGFTSYYGGSEGLLSFSSMEEIVEAVAMIQADYPRHSRAAREISLEYFEATTVLRSLLERACVI